MDTEETQQGGSELCCDPACCRASKAAGFISTLLLDNFSPPAHRFFLIAMAVQSCNPWGAAVVTRVPSHTEPGGTKGLWSSSLQPGPPFSTPVRQSGRPQRGRAFAVSRQLCELECHSDPPAAACAFRVKWISTY